jgi:spermidine synthase
MRGVRVPGPGNHPPPATDAGGPAWRSCLPAELLEETGIVQLNEPAGSDIGGLVQRLRDGAYHKPFVIDDGRVRRLYFGLAYVQSEMSIARPHELNFAYTRKMMGFLLFVPRPKHVVIVGLGGGSLTRFCHRQLPRARITTVEIDREVIAFGDLFELPVQDERHVLIQADAVDYFATTADRPADRPDVVLLDGCDNQGMAPAFRNAGFFRSVRDRLKTNGVLVVNLVGSAAALRTTLAIVGETFAGRMIVQDVGEGGTKVAYAFNDSAFEPDWDGLLGQARELGRKHELDLPALARKLKRSGVAADSRTR